MEKVISVSLPVMRTLSVAAIKSARGSMATDITA